MVYWVIVGLGTSIRHGNWVIGSLGTAVCYDNWTGLFEDCYSREFAATGLL
jgi:hypothetical protein